MQKIILLLTLLFCIGYSKAQNSITIVIKDNTNQLPIGSASVTIQNNNFGKATNSAGVATLKYFKW